MRYTILKTPEYQKWLDKETKKSRVQIEERLSKIEIEGYFGIRKDLGDHIFELKWRNGRRVYYSYILDLQVLLLIGGNKNGQEKDIKQAKKIFKRYVEVKA